ncbi:hypothetical protein KW805_00175 [Candidatus Pacearchaeota archaeon]|nr:hypothetical protein [Candidatus Pacearchaeota archaeon]
MTWLTPAHTKVPVRGRKFYRDNLSNKLERTLNYEKNKYIKSQVHLFKPETKIKKFFRLREIACRQDGLDHVSYQGTLHIHDYLPESDYTSISIARDNGTRIPLIARGHVAKKLDSQYVRYHAAYAQDEKIPRHSAIVLHDRKI